MDRDEKPKKFDVDATIQLDKLDAEQFTVPESVPDLAKRVTPPPLPPEEIARASRAPSAAPPTVSHAPSAPPPKPRSMGMTIGLIAGFVVLVIVAIVGGLHVGGLARGTAPSASVSVAAAPTPTLTPTPTPSPTPSASASGHVEITIPTIEMR